MKECNLDFLFFGGGVGGICVGVGDVGVGICKKYFCLVVLICFLLSVLL